MKRSLLITEFLASVWALHPAALTKFSGVLQRWNAGLSASPEVMAAILADKEARAVKRQAAQQSSGGGIAVLPLYGVITQRGNMADDISGPGSCSTQQFTQSLRSALADQTVAQILIDIDSPGGSVYGVQELSDEIYSARATKPVIGIANSLAASAAYWIGAACSELYCTPSGEVGSIGVYTAHQDMSKMLAEEGINISLISAGRFKTEGNPYQPLTDEARAAIQQSVDNYYAMFTKGVSKYRGVSIGSVRDGMGQGRCLNASDALAEKMVDGVMDFDDVVAMMQKNMRANRGTSAEISAPEVIADVSTSFESQSVAIFNQVNSRKRELSLLA